MKASNALSTMFGLEANIQLPPSTILASMTGGQRMFFDADNSIKKENEALKQKLGKIQDSLKAEQISRKDTEEMVSTKDAELKRIRSRVDAIQESLTKLRSRVRGISNHKDSLDVPPQPQPVRESSRPETSLVADIDAQCSHLEQSIVAQSQQLEATELELKRERSANRGIQEERDRLNADLTEAQETIATFLNQMGQFEQDHKNLAKENQKIPQLKLSVKKVEQQLDQIRKRLNEREHHIETLEQENTRMSINAALMTQENKGLHEDYNRRRVTVDNFRPMDIVLFLRTVGGAYKAYRPHDNEPVYFLDPVSSGTMRGSQIREAAILGEVVTISEPKGAKENNPYKLAAGTLYSVIVAASFEFK